MRVLVVEDDPALGAFLAKGLKLAGHEVHLAGDGESALEYADTFRPALVVLDLSLPRRNGMDVLGELRARGNDASVLVVSGQYAVESRVDCLNLGADDFLAKPFSFFELVARCRALLRRREYFADPVLRYADLQLNRIDRKVQRGDRVIDLTAKEFSLLEFLLLNVGECVPRARLLIDVWQMSPSAGTNVVDVYINYLRRKLCGGEAQAEADPLIETVRGLGYRLGVAQKKPAARSLPTSSTHLLSA